MALRRAAGTQLSKRGFWLFTEYRYEHPAGAFRMGSRGFEQALRALDEGSAAAIGRDGERTLWWTGDAFYWADEEDGEHVALLAWDRRRRDEARLERLRKQRAHEAAAAVARRQRVPPDVRTAVWFRDEGRCVECGAEDDLQFDHVIPLARGGGSTTANVQLLCGDCNRLKSDSLG
jgi:hypothetical protein